MEYRSGGCSRVLEFCFFLLLCLMSSVCTTTNDACRKCSCKQNGVVNCVELEELPPIETFPRNTTTLRVDKFSKEISLPPDILQHLEQLKSLTLHGNKIIKRIKKFKVKNGISNLLMLSFSDNIIESIEKGAFDDLQKLSTLHLSNNRLTEFPTFNKTSSISKLSLRENPGITALSAQSLENLPSLETLDMRSTGIQEIPAGVFRKNTKLLELDFSNTKTLTTINEDAFDEDLYLRTLVLDETRITSLPSRGLKNVRVLSLKGVPNLWQLPELDSVNEVYLSPYNGFLCCAFESGKKYGLNCIKQRPSGEENTGQTTALTPSKDITEPQTTFGGFPGFNPSTRSHTTSGFGGGGLPGFNPPTQSRTTSGFGGGGVPGFNPPTQSPTTSGFGGGGVPGFGTRASNKPSPTNQIIITIPGVHNTTVVPLSLIPHSNQTPTYNPYQCPKVKVKCFPKSDAFHPCEDIMGHVLLTIVSAMVGSAALVTNLVVALVLLTSQRRLNVTRLLMCNLAFADFCLGLYIFILTCVSIATHGEYHNFAQRWQNGAGCKILGFLAVFSSELSLFTLVMMTVERFYAIVHAMHMNARLSFRMAVRFLIGGWIFALLMAALPLIDFSGYTKVAICLPFDVSDARSKAYVAFLLLVNGVSFACVVYLYSRMLYVVVSGGDMEGAPKRNDSKVAKRMAVLVFTDMLCWAPIAFFGLLAAFGQTLLTVTESKVLLVFFFPINSLCNPFLYAFVTKAFKRELFTALSRIGFCKFRALKYNGTLSSFLYSRSRRNQSNVNEASTPKSKHSTTSLTQSNLTLYRKESKQENAGTVNGICNTGFAPGQGEARTSPGSVRYVASATGSDQVFFPTTPKAIENKTDSPKSIIKKDSSTENPSRGFSPKDDTQLAEKDTTDSSASPLQESKNGVNRRLSEQVFSLGKDDIQLVGYKSLELR